MPQIGRSRPTLAGTRILLAESEHLLEESADQLRSSRAVQDRTSLLVTRTQRRLRECEALLARTRLQLRNTEQRCCAAAQSDPPPLAEVETRFEVLIADDDPALLGVISGFLRPVYAVWTARDGFEAMRVLLDRHIDLLITDLNMPGIDGMQLVKQATVLWPALKFLYLTGFPERAETLCPALVLYKPIRSEAFLGMVAREMARA